MAQVKVLTMDGAEAGTIELKDEIFAIEPNENAGERVSALRRLFISSFTKDHRTILRFYGAERPACP